MSSDPLTSFDPFATHPFTSGQSPPPPHLHRPPPTRMPAPSPSAAPAPAKTQPADPPSSSSSSSSKPLPVQLATKWPPAQQPGPVFTPWKQERSSTPELCDVLAKKKSGTAWPAQPVFVAKSKGKGDGA